MAILLFFEKFQLKLINIIEMRAKTMKQRNEKKGLFQRPIFKNCSQTALYLSYGFCSHFLILVWAETLCSEAKWPWLTFIIKWPHSKNVKKKYFFQGKVWAISEISNKSIFYSARLEFGLKASGLQCYVVVPNPEVLFSTLGACCPRPRGGQSNQAKRSRVQARGGVCIIFPLILFYIAELSLHA